MNFAPLVGIFSNQILPLWRVTIYLQSHKPKPMLAFLDSLSSSNKLGWASNGMPGPLSENTILTS